MSTTLQPNQHLHMPRPSLLSNPALVGLGRQLTCVVGDALADQHVGGRDGTLAFIRQVDHSAPVARDHCEQDQ